MGQTESKIEIDFDVEPSKNSFLNEVLASFEDVRSFPADLDTGFRQIISEGPQALSELKVPRGAFKWADDDTVVPEIVNAVLAYYPEVDSELREACVPKPLDENEFWKRFFFRLSRTRSYQEEREAAIEAVIKACKVTASVHKHLIKGDTLKKNDKSPVTVADFSSQAVIISELRRQFPDVPVVGEEDATELRSNGSMRSKVFKLTKKGLPNITGEEVLDAIDYGTYEGGPSGKHWALDPIDGTKGFIRGEQYAVCLGLIEDGEVVLGVLGCPNLPYGTESKRGCLFVAVRGEGAFMRALSGTTEIPIAVSSAKRASEGNFCESVEAAHSNHSDSATIAQLLNVTKPPIRMDSQCKYAAVARGDATIYLRLPTRKGYEEKIWDHTAGALIVAEAGGKVTDVRGEKLDFSLGRTLKNNTGVIATNGLVHEEVVQAVRQVLFPASSFTVSLRGKETVDEQQIARALAAQLKINEKDILVQKN